MSTRFKVQRARGGMEQYIHCQRALVVLLGEERQCRLIQATRSEFAWPARLLTRNFPGQRSGISQQAIVGNLPFVKRLEYPLSRFCLRTFLFPHLVSITRTLLLKYTLGSAAGPPRQGNVVVEIQP